MKTRTCSVSSRRGVPAVWFPALCLALSTALIPSAGHAQVRTLPDTVRVLAVMVEFQEDADARTSGTGKFGTIYPQDYGAEIIDPLPHDRAYFEAHLRFLENYVAKASGGRTSVVSRVLDHPVTVPKTIREYSPRKGQPETAVAQLAVDAWSIADTAFSGVDLSAYDMFVVFHASRGRDIDLASMLGADPTPFDIPSLSFTLNSFKRLFGASYDGIPVRGGSFRIQNTAVLPSTNVREIPLLTGGTGLLELTTNGLLAASFGTWAGLPDLFDTKKGVTGIGRFGLMDPESIFAYGGICPPAPSAWEKQALGWTLPREAAPGRRPYLISAQRFDQPSTADVLRVPITAREYWLVENRQRDPAGNGQRVTMHVGDRDLDLRFPKDTTGFENGSIALLKGVVTDVEDLDWSLPGGTVITDNAEQRVNGGILIWHVDETIIARGLADNTVNADPAQRGLDLEQAGGAQDIGKTIQSIFGASIGAGSPVDYWFNGNIAPLYVNSFSMLTNPAARANNGAFTHVTMDHFGQPGPLMSFEIALGDNTLAPVEGWPVDLRPRIGSDSADVHVQTADLDGDGLHEVLVSAGRGTAAAADSAFVFAFRSSGAPYPGGAGSTGCIQRTAAVTRLVGAPLIGELDASAPGPEIVQVTCNASATTVHLYSSRDGNGDGVVDELRAVTHPNMAFGGDEGPAASAFSIQHGTLLYVLTGTGMDTLVTIGTDVTRTGVPHARGSLRAIGSTTADGTGLLIVGDGVDAPAYLDPSSGSVTGTRVGPVIKSPPSLTGPFNLASADFDGDGRIETAAPTQAGITLAAPFGDGRQDFLDDVHCGALMLSGNRRALAAADADGDGRMDLLVADSTRLTVLNAALAAVDDYPTRTSARAVFAARLAGDTRDALFLAGDGMLSQLITGARQADGFPVPLPRNASVVLAPLGGTDATLGVATAGDGGVVYLFDTRSRLAERGLRWRAPLGDETQRCVAVASGDAVAAAQDFFPQDRCYNWPNPVYDKRTAIRFFVSKDADVRVKIVDVAGDLVTELQARALGGIDNEIVWDASAIESGVYLARVLASAPGFSGEKIIKIAIVR